MILLLIITAMMSFNAPSSDFDISKDTPVNVTSDQRTVRFRSNQFLRSNDGRSLYFYTSGYCEGYDGDRCMFKCKYTLVSGEVRLLDEYGNTVYKGSYRMKSDGCNLQSVSISGTTYWAR